MRKNCSRGVPSPATITHPLGVRPLGNLLVDRALGISDARRPGLGALARLSDELLLEALEFLGPRDVSRFGGASRVAYAYAAHEDLWRTLVLHTFGGPSSWSFTGKWRTTAIARELRGDGARAAAALRAFAKGPPFTACRVYSDVLFQSHLSSAIDVDPRWLRGDSIARERAADFTPAAFRARYDDAGTPFVLSGAGAAWPGWRALDGGAWGAAALEAAHGSVSFHTAGFDCTLSEYLAYARAEESDQPLYLFDAAFAEKAPALGQFAAPAAFREDLFALLGPDRPDFRWLIAGPRKSGSVFHQDPNGTSAFNACLQGSKLWILLPPDMTPPGVFASADGEQVCAPLSVMEWLHGFYAHFEKARDARLRAIAGAAGADAGAGAKRPSAGAALQAPVEGVVRAGDVVFVPRGWWHLVLNLDSMNVAITSNFCSRDGLPHVLRFLRDKPDAVSGVRPVDAAGTLLPRFRAALAAAEPEELARADARLAEEAAPKNAGKTGKWARVLEQSSGDGAFSLSASFNFTA